MGRRGRVALAVALIGTAVKLLLVPSYRSTDFEVHRNWLAVTHSLPRTRWYWDATSEWTLDYPPLFALFEWFLSQAAPLFDARMLEVDNLRYASDATILFQRLTVIVTDGVLLAGAWALCASLWPRRNGDTAASAVAIALACLNCGLLLVDHVHFQYNGFLLGILLLSLAALTAGHDLLGALIFTSLLMLKHIFVYAAPFYFVYLLRHYCFPVGPAQARAFAAHRLVLLATACVAVVATVLAPFVWPHLQLHGVSAAAAAALQRELKQLLSRLFPWGRGLVHAYWAPNVWALYMFADTVFAKVGGALGVSVGGGGVSRGLVQHAQMRVLPTIVPAHAFALWLITSLPVLRRVWIDPQPRRVCAGVACCMFSAFMVLWHVHEKAILMVTLPLGFAALAGAGPGTDAEAQLYWLTATIGHASLVPLLFRSTEVPVTLLFVLIFAIGSFLALRRIHGPTFASFLSPSATQLPMSTAQLAVRGYLLVLAAAVAFQVLIHPAFFCVRGEARAAESACKFEFLPLMVLSVVCASCLVVCWVRLLYALS